MELHSNKLTEVNNLPWHFCDFVSGEKIGSNHSHLRPGKTAKKSRVSRIANYFRNLQGKKTHLIPIQECLPEEKGKYAVNYKERPPDIAPGGAMQRNPYASYGS